VASGALLLAVVPLTAALACRQLADIGDRAEAVGPAAMCGTLVLPSGACGTCVAEQCCDENRACASDLACADRHACSASCDPADRACSAACVSQLRDFGVPDDLATCASARCGAPCALACGGYQYRLPTCAPCVQEHCCDEATACALDPTCTAVAQCLIAVEPGDWGEMNRCYAADYDSAIKDPALRSCLRQSCAEACGLRRSWECVGSVSPPKPIEGTLLFAIELVTLGDSRAAGVQVVACNALSEPCAEVTRSTSNDQGVAVIEIANTESRFNGYLQLSHPDFIPSRMSWSPALTGNPPTGAWPLTTWSEIDLLAAEIKVLLDHALGMAVIAVRDCGDEPATGVRLAVSDANARVLYIRQNRPSPTAADTDDTGLGFVGNIEPGIHDVMAYDGTDRLVARTPVTIRSGIVSYVQLSPTE